MLKKLIIISGSLLLVCCLLPTPVAPFVGTLIAGWAFFLYRVVPQMTIAPATVLTGVVGAMAFVIGLHAFLNWLTSPRPDADDNTLVRWRFRWTLGLCVLVLLTFAAGIATVGVVHQVGWLITSPGPLTEGGMRRLAARTMSMNNLKQMALAAHNHHDSHGQQFPPGYTVDGAGRPLHGWQAQLLPYLDQQALYQQVHFDQPWDRADNRTALQTEVKVYLVPVESYDHDSTGYALSHFTGNSRFFPKGQGIGLKNVTDGIENTIMMGEVTTGYRPWGHPLNLRDPARGIDGTGDSLGSHWSNRGPLVAMADGSVRTLSKTVSPAVLRALSTPAGGEPVPKDFDD
jgi:hypothetical protein